MTTPFTMTPEYSLQQSSSNSLNLPQTPTSLNTSSNLAANSTPILNEYQYKSSNFSFESPCLNTKVQSSLPSTQQQLVSNKLNLDDSNNYNNYEYASNENTWKQQQTNQQNNSAPFYLY